LTDQAKRSLYDMIVKSHVRDAVPKTSSYHSNVNVFAENQVPTATKYPKECSSNVPWNPHLNAEQLIFWTLCQHCKGRFQYQLNIMNMVISCHNCKKNFKAQAISISDQQAAPSSVPFGPPKEAPMQAPPKPASKSNRGKSKKGYFTVSKSKPTKPRASKNVGSKRLRQPKPDAKERLNNGR